MNHPKSNHHSSKDHYRREVPDTTRLRTYTRMRRVLRRPRATTATARVTAVAITRRSMSKQSHPDLGLAQCTSFCTLVGATTGRPCALRPRRDSTIHGMRGAYGGVWHRGLTTHTQLYRYPKYTYSYHLRHGNTIPKPLHTTRSAHTHTPPSPPGRAMITYHTSSGNNVPPSLMPYPTPHRLVSCAPPFIAADGRCLLGRGSRGRSRSFLHPGWAAHVPPLPHAHRTKLANSSLDFRSPVSHGSA